MKKLMYTVIVAFACLTTGCKDDKFLDPVLAQSKEATTGLVNANDLQLLLNNMYDNLTSSSYYGRNVIIYGTVRSDDAFSNENSGRFSTESNMNYTPSSAGPSDTWTFIYRVVRDANLIIGSEGIEGDEKTINHITGQAHALRALAYYDLVRLYGQQHVTGAGGMSGLGVPYVDKFKDEDQLLPARSTVQEIKDKIDENFTQALELMDPDKNDASKITLTTHAVNALWSRAAVYFSDWQRAISTAKAVIDAKAGEVIAEDKYIASWYTDASVNSLFELAVLTDDNLGINGLSYIYRIPAGIKSGYGDIQAQENIKGIFSEGDIRADTTSMIGKNPPPTAPVLRNLGKYPNGTPLNLSYNNNIRIIRYEEVLLNYAEALLETGGSQADILAQLNAITSQRGTAAYTGTITRDDILLERRKELCFEGLRFDDLARTQKNIPLKSGAIAYGNTYYAFPIPRNEIDANPNMVQNEGYTE